MCATLDELPEFFRDPPLDKPCSFHNVVFCVFHTAAFKLNWFALAMGHMPVEIRDPVEVGDYVVVWLPVPVGAELLLRSRGTPQAEEDGLDAYFEIEATLSAMARRRLGGPFAAELLRLYADYHFIEMRDEYILFGPLVRTPLDNAASLAALIDAVGALCSSFHDETVVEPDLGPHAAFCFYCGFTVHEGTAVCPRCGERIDEGLDEDAEAENGGRPMLSKSAPVFSSRWYTGALRLRRRYTPGLERRNRTIA
jgi:hypothetical protein